MAVRARGVVSYTPRDTARPRRFYYAEDLTAAQAGQPITTTGTDGWPVRGILQTITLHPSQGVAVLEVTRGGRTTEATVTLREGVLVHAPGG